MEDERSYHGYLSNGNGCIYPMLDQIYRHEKYDMNEKSLAIFNSIISICKKKQIELSLLYAPEYEYRLQGYVQNFDSIIKVINNIAVANNLAFYRDDSLDICKEKCFFANYGHLNTAGAIAYSKIWATRLDSLRKINLVDSKLFTLQNIPHLQ